MFWWHMKSTYALWKLSGRNNDAGDGYAIICIQAHKISFRMHFSFTCTCTSMHAHTHTHTITHIYIYIYICISQEVQNKLQCKDLTCETPPCTWPPTLTRLQRHHAYVITHLIFRSMCYLIFCYYIAYKFSLLTTLIVIHYRYCECWGSHNA